MRRSAQTTVSCPNASIFDIESSDLCGPDGYIPYDKNGLSVYAPGLVNATCGDVAISAYLMKEFDNETCPVVAESVNDTCCTFYTPVCDDICGYGRVSFRDA
jgi:hypothetical protein